VPQGRRERKIVTVLFADLVGFTSRAEQLDPEDVADELGRYHEHVRTELERYGGTVEKFIGDAIMALFGAPTTHEDDLNGRFARRSRFASGHSRRAWRCGSESTAARRSCASTPSPKPASRWRPAT
jgi:class 3 adenylate cyclase